MNRVRAAALGCLLSVVLVACSSSTGNNATPTPSPTPTVTPTAAASVIALPSLPSNAKELEALLPNTLGGKTLTKASMKGSDFVTASQSPELTAWLNSLGKSLNDVSAAYAFDLSGTTPAFIFAFRVAGVDHSQLISTLETQFNKDATTKTTWTSATVGGKSVQAGPVPDSDSTPVQNIYLYGTGDVVFFVETASQPLAQEALQDLP